MVLNGSHCYLYGINVTKHVKKWSKECNQTFVFQTTKTILNSSNITLCASSHLPPTPKDRQIHLCKANITLKWKFDHKCIQGYFLFMLFVLVHSYLSLLWWDLTDAQLNDLYVIKRCLCVCVSAAPIINKKVMQNPTFFPKRFKPRNQKKIKLSTI